MKLKLMLFVVCTCISGLNLEITRADTATHVYQCVINGQRVFSDHVCGDDAVERDVTVTSRMDTIKTPASKVTTSRSRRKQSSSSESDTRRQRCLRISKAKDALVERMRAGYTAKQDERMHNQLHKLDNEYFELRCSGVS